MLVSYLLSHPEVFRTIKSVNIVWVCIMVVLNSLLILLKGIILQTILRSFNVNLTLIKCFGISSLTAMGNYLFVLGGGSIGKAFYLKRKHDFPYAAFLASTAATYILSFILVSIIGAITVLIVNSAPELPVLPLFWSFIALGAFIGLFLFLPVKRITRGGKVSDMINNVLEGWRVIKSDYTFIVRISLLLLMSYFLVAAELFFSFKAFSLDVPFSSSMLIGVVTTLSDVIRITPANLGFEEAIIAFSSQILGVGFGPGLMAAGLSRAVVVMTIFLWGAIFSFCRFDESR